jgi:hypothetical protein
MVHFEKMNIVQYVEKKVINNMNVQLVFVVLKRRVLNVVYVEMVHIPHGIVH